MKRFDINDILRPKSRKILLQRGRILIAEPFMQGFYFSRSVILITEINEKETIGLVLNKTSDINPNELIYDIPNYTGTLYLGGPVEPNSLHYLHTLGELLPGAEKITDNIYYGGDFDRLIRLIRKGDADLNSVKFFAGYTGWEGKQLLDELNEAAWVVSTIDNKKIMLTNSTDLWNSTLIELGNIYKSWINIPQQPAFN
jgi:putative transcriptional regulator